MLKAELARTNAKKKKTSSRNKSGFCIADASLCLNL